MSYDKVVRYKQYVLQFCWDM